MRIPQVGSRAALVVLLASLSFAARATTLIPIVSEGDAAPGFEAGARIYLLNAVTLPARLAADGTVTFGAVVRRADGSLVHAIYRQRDGQAELLFRAGDAAPGSGGATFSGFPFFPDPPLSSGGATAFVASVVKGASSPPLSGVWVDRGGSFDRLAGVGDALDAMPPGESLADFDILIRGATTILRGRFTRGAQLFNEDNGVWRDRGNGFEAVAVKGMPAPGVAGARLDGDTPGRGTVFSTASQADGKLLVQAWVDGGAVTDGNDEGLWLENAGKLRLLVREGQRVFDNRLGRRGATFGPTSATVPTFGGDNENLPPAVNDAGEAIFGAVLRSRAGRSGSVWTTRSGAPELLALGSLGLRGSGPASHAPGFGAKVTFATFQASAINNRGHVAFLGTANEFGAPRFTPGLWWDAPGTLSLVTAVGRPVPDLPGGAVSAIESLEQLSDAPEIVFVARIARQGAATVRAVLRGSRDTPAPSVVVRTGQSATIDGVGVEISNLVLGRGVSNDRHVVALLGFVGRPTGLFLVAIPE